MRTLLDLLQIVATAVTAVGVILVWNQVRLTKRQATTTFEDSLSKEFRDLTKELPSEALLGQPLAEHQQLAHLGVFYRYIDLSNQEVYLRKIGRISDETWVYWCDGIRAFLALPAFAAAWGTIKAAASGAFEELRQLELEGFKSDPSRWGGTPSSATAPSTP
ncbi:MAG: hypothetical protein LAO51_18535 [Acidobacteriia bacterium]|nr:hypothetical protein [Terriglobia bacterium]